MHRTRVPPCSSSAQAEALRRLAATTSVCAAEPSCHHLRGAAWVTPRRAAASRGLRDLDRPLARPKQGICRALQGFVAQSDA